MGSCSVMRGSKTGFETKLHESLAVALIDIDGDSCHHIHNACKNFMKNFSKYLKKLYQDSYNDFKLPKDILGNPSYY